MKPIAIAGLALLALLLFGGMFLVSTNNAIITLRGTGCTASDTMKTGAGFIGRLCNRAGGTLSYATDDKEREYTIRIGGLI